MRNFKVIHQGAGPFTEGQIITDEAIAAAGHDIERWLRLGAVEEVAEAARSTGNPAASGDQPPVPPALPPENSPRLSTGTPLPGVETAPSPAPTAPVEPAPTPVVFDPVIATKPLSYYDGKSDAQILADKTVNVGPAKLKEIHEARKAREQAR
jgi:hypothetical protein